MWLFKRKKKDTKPKWDMSKFKIRFTIKSMCVYERLSGKSFQNCMNTEEDLMMYMYALFVSNNDIYYTYSVFKIMMEDNEELSKWLYKECGSIMKYNAQMNKKKEDEEQDNTESKTELWAKDIASFLIIQGHIDPHYVYNEMEMWEAEGYYDVLEKARKDKYEEERLWTYMTIAPHIDGKKIKSPEDILKFPWEKSTKEKAEDDLNSKQQMILNTLKNMNKVKEEKENDNG